MAAQVTHPISGKLLFRSPIHPQAPKATFQEYAPSHSPRGLRERFGESTQSEKGEEEEVKAEREVPSESSPFLPLINLFLSSHPLPVFVAVTFMPLRLEEWVKDSFWIAAMQWLDGLANHSLLRLVRLREWWPR